MKEGDRIKVFPETKVDVYLRHIRQSGYNCHLEDNFIVIGEKVTWKYDSKKLGSLIYSKRNEKHMTRLEFAEVIEVTPNSVLSWEIGRFAPREYYLSGIKQILDITEEELKECRI